MRYTLTSVVGVASLAVIPTFLFQSCDPPPEDCAVVICEPVSASVLADGRVLVFDRNNDLLWDIPVERVRVEPRP